MGGFRLHQHGSLQYYTIDAFEQTGLVKHCFTTRHGGVSGNEYASMNLRMNCSDDRNNVLKNYDIICKEIGVNYQNLVCSNQVHDDKIYTAEKKDMGKGIVRPSDIESADGLICREAGVPICTVFADCVPLYFLDPQKRVIALSHSGWKGTVKRIGQKTIQKMHDEYGCQPDDILAAVGPSIGVCHFEVGDEVAEVFDREFGASVVQRYRKSYHVDLQKAVLMQFDEAGLKREHVTCADICTYCNSDLLFSHRATGGRRGNLAAIMELK